MPMPVTYANAPEGNEWSIAGKPIPVGFMVTYICQACGFTEWWVAKPEEIPIGAEYGTEIVDASDNAPYR